MNNKIKGHSAILIANTIFGLGIPVTKYLLDSWVTPMTYMASRCIGAAAIFWLISFFMPKEHIRRKDLVIIILGGLTGVVISQTLTAWALNYTSPVYYSLIATLTPIFVMVLAAPLLKEKISATKIFGIILGITGAMLMVVCKWQSSTGSNDLPLYTREVAGFEDRFYARILPVAKSLAMATFHILALAEPAVCRFPLQPSRTAS